MKKSATLPLITVLVLSSLVMVNAVSAQSIPKPPVPEFTVKYVAHPYDVPTTYSTDPYTGETITHEGYHVENKSIEVWITNQAFTPYTDKEGDLIRLYYDVRVKGHFGDSWASIFHGSSESEEYTIEYYIVGESAADDMMRNLSAGDQLDFQVEAKIGKYSQFIDNRQENRSSSMYVSVFTGETSGWSETQTVTIP
jgi:hypothetical protein